MDRRLASICALTAALAAALASCGGDDPPPPPAPPKASIPLPTGAALLPWSAANPPLARPQQLAASSDGRVWAALTGLDANYAPAGPGLLAGAVPSTGEVTLVDLANGGDGRACINAGYVKADPTAGLAVTCSGQLFGGAPDSRGRALVLVDPAQRKVTATAAAPAGVNPSAVAGTSDRFWVGDFSAARLYPVARSPFAFGAAVTLPCPESFVYVGDLLIAGDDLFALCSASDGYLVRLDARTGAVKGSRVLVGAQPVALARTGDGRLAVVNSISGTVSLVTVTASTMTVALDAIKLDKNASPQGVRSRGSFLYLAVSGTNTVQKWDLAAAGGPKLLRALPTGEGSFPWDLELLDDNLAVVSLSTGGALAGLDFAKAP